MRELTITEFGNYCKQNEFISYVYESSNQEIDSLDYLLCFNLEFKSIVLSHSPNRVYLKDGDKYIGFFGVKHINVQTQPNGDDIFFIICSDDLLKIPFKKNIIHKVIAKHM